MHVEAFGVRLGSNGLAMQHAACWVLVAALMGCDSGSVKTAELSNPIAPLRPSEEPALSPAGLDSADPFIFTWDGRYWLTHTGQTRVVLRSADTLGGLASAAVEEVWRPGEGGAPPEYAGNVWAPEFHRLEGPNGWRFYLYVAADPGNLTEHRMLVLESQADDPRGPYEFKGLLDTGGFAIDATVATVGGRTYALYSGHATTALVPASLYIAELSDPWTFAGPPVLISSPTYPWEQESAPINEGPQILLHGPWLHVIFSADSCLGPAYKLGRLTVRADADLLDPTTWADAKAPEPVFQTSAAAGVYGPGHGSFFQSLDGREDWQIYHATSSPGVTCITGLPRLARAQRFTYRDDGTPDFGEPLGLEVPLAPPSSDPTLTRQLDDDGPAEVSGGVYGVVEDDRYVGGRAGELEAEGPDASLAYRVELPADGEYRLLVRMAVGPDRGIVRLDVDGESSPLGAADGYREIADAAEIDFGTMHLARGSVLLRFIITGKSAASSGYGFAADQIRLR